MWYHDDTVWRDRLLLVAGWTWARLRLRAKGRRLPFWIKPFPARTLHCSCVQGRSCGFLLILVRRLVMGRRREWQSMDVPSGWVQILRGSRSLLISGPEWMCSASVNHMHQWEQDPSANGDLLSSSHHQRQRQFGDSPQQSNVPRVSKSPDEVRKCAFAKVARLQAAIASLDEDDQERSSLQQALERAQQQTVLPPVDQRIADCVQFIERAKKRVQSAEADVKKAVEAQRLREGELAAATFGRPPARSCRGRGCSLHNSTSTNASGGRPANKRSPSRVASEIQRLRTEVARFKARANQPVRDSVEAAQIVRAAAEKRRTDEQNLRSWLEDKNLEMRDGLDACDTEAISLLGPFIAKGANGEATTVTRCHLVRKGEGEGYPRGQGLESSSGSETCPRGASWRKACGGRQAAGGDLGVVSALRTEHSSRLGAGFVWIRRKTTTGRRPTVLASRTSSVSAVSPPSP